MAHPDRTFVFDRTPNHALFLAPANPQRPRSMMEIKLYKVFAHQSQCLLIMREPFRIRERNTTLVSARTTNKSAPAIYLPTGRQGAAMGYYKRRIFVISLWSHIVGDWKHTAPEPYPLDNVFILVPPN